MIGMFGARQTSAALAFQFDLDTSDFRLGRELQYHFSSQEVQICVMSVAAV